MVDFTTVAKSYRVHVYPIKTDKDGKETSIKVFIGQRLDMEDGSHFLLHKSGSLTWHTDNGKQNFGCFRTFRREMGHCKALVSAVEKGLGIVPEPESRPSVHCLARQLWRGRARAGV